MNTRAKIEAIRLADLALRDSGSIRPHIIDPLGRPTGISYEGLSLSNAMHERGEWHEADTRNDGNLPGQRILASRAGMHEITPGIWRFPT
jgi:hypothetical protein